MKQFVGKTAPTKKIDFLGEKNGVEIRKMSLAEVQAMQSEIRKLQEGPGEDADAGLAATLYVLRKTVVGADELTDEQFGDFPLGDLLELSKTALQYSGVDVAAGNA